MTTRALSLIAAALALLASACGGGDSASGCDEPFQEQLDPASELHLLGGEEVEYLTDPPTSGPHGVAVIPGSVLTEPIGRSTQVGILEAGRVLVQYRDDVSDADVSMLTAIGDATIVVAPNPTLAEPLVATAWTWKMECGSVDDDTVADLVAFAEAHSSGAPGSD